MILENFYFSKINIPIHYPEQKIWKLFTVLGGKFKLSAQDSDLEYLSWRSKNSPVSSDLKPPLGAVGSGIGTCLVFCHSFSDIVHIVKDEKIEPFCGTNKCRGKNDCKNVGTKRDMQQYPNNGQNEARLCNKAGRCVYNKRSISVAWDK